MDAIAGLLDGPRARGAFLLKLAFDPPWALRIQDEAPIAVISVVRGSTLIIADGERAGPPPGRRRGDRPRPAAVR